MSTFTNSMLGLAFLGLAFFASLLMYKLWGYPFDKQKLKSEAPPFWILVHKLLGWAFVIIYVLLMWQMIPRLWNYQVELPPRTVMHLTMGLAIGIMLFVKIVIVRFFRYLEDPMAPLLGTGILIATFILVSLSVPLALRDIHLSQQTLGGTVFSDENIKRVQNLLPTAGFPPEADLKDLTSIKTLKRGRDVLQKKCVVCHDMRTILARPKTPANWVKTVNRMVERSLFEPYTPAETWAVSAYLIAISPELQKAVKQQRQEEETAENAKAALETLNESFEPAEDNTEEHTGEPEVDLAAARELCVKLCNQCHDFSEIETYPLASKADVVNLVDRMIDEGLEIEKDELQQVIRYLKATYVTH
ncbi:MAG: hypothetical protein D6675_03460 [Gemmatimonadetes bacterium]|nr:MAG: hypothetical protein D6675_03460 [Gemmatimonadota bacterium]